MKKTNHRFVHPEHPEPIIIAEACSIIKTGGIVIYPTRGLYGLGADARNETALLKIIAIKGRPPDKPISVLIGKHSDLDDLVSGIPLAASHLMKLFWPGKLTIVFQARKAVQAYITADTGKIGIRLPEQPVAAALVKAIKSPLTATSANRSGKPGVFRISDLDADFLKKVDLILDAGELKGGLGSTVVDVTTDPPQVLRAGEISEKELSEALASAHFNRVDKKK